MAKHGDAANTKPVTTAHTARHPIETRRIGGKAGRSRYACRFGNDVRPFEHVTHAWSTHRPSAWPYRVWALPNYPLALASPFPIMFPIQHSRRSRGRRLECRDFVNIKYVFFTQVFAHLCVASCMPYARLGGGIHLVTLQIANRMAGSLRKTRLWTLPCYQLSESINHLVLGYCRILPPRVRSSRSQRAGW